MRFYEYAIDADAAATLAGRPPSGGLWHHWALTETSGTTAADTGVSYTQTDGAIAATLVGNAALICGDLGGIALDGDGDFITFED